MRITTVISLDGVEYEFDRLNLAEARMVKAVTGMKPEAFATELFSGDPDALTALLMILKKRQGLSVRYEEIDGDLSTFDITYKDEKGRVVTAKRDPDGSEVLGPDKSTVLLFDGVEDPDPTEAPEGEAT